MYVARIPDTQGSTQNEISTKGMDGDFGDRCKKRNKQWRLAVGTAVRLVPVYSVVNFRVKINIPLRRSISNCSCPRLFVILIKRFRPFIDGKAEILFLAFAQLKDIQYVCESRPLTPSTKIG